jgi:mono/diheme cytochrome c family protein
MSQNQPSGDGRGAEHGESTVGGFIEQAMKGRESFNQNCGSCHGEDLRGRASAPPLSGTAFTSRWQNTPVGDLFERIRATMPQASPDSLGRQTYLDILVYLLRANDMLSRQQAIEDSPDALKGLTSGRAN